MIDHLPYNSHFTEAVLNDEDYARAVIDLELPPRQERVSEWSPEREALAQIGDALRGLAAVTVAVHGGKPGPVRISDRPATAFDHVREEAKQRRYEQLLARILGGQN